MFCLMPAETDKTKTVAVVEDDETFRLQVKDLLDTTAGFRCIGDFANAREALKGIPELKPHFVLMDIHMPGLSGIECVKQLKEILPSVQVLILTAFEETDKIFRALRAGASGYLVKGDAPERLLEAICELERGGSPMSSHIARKVVQHFHLLGPQPEPADSLSPREREILDLLAAGYFYKEIADKLGITWETVKTHVMHIYEKLHVHTRHEAVAKYQSR